MNPKHDQMCVVVLVLADLEYLQAILEHWMQAGTSGITITDSTGGIRLHERLRMDDIPLFPSINSLLDAGAGELIHKTLFAVVPDSATAKRLADTTEQIWGDLSQPGKGIFFSMPVTNVRGYRPAQ